MGSWIGRLLSSRKVVLAIVGIALPWLNTKLGMSMTPDQVADAMMMLGAVIFGIAYEDGQAKANGHAPGAPAPK